MTIPTPAARRAAIEQAVEPWRSRALHQVIDDAASMYADRPLVITDDLTLTYAEVRDRSRDLAAGLAALGIRKGDRVAFVMANFPDFVPIKVAIARAGAVAVPVNYLYRADELSYVLRQSRANVVITMSSFLDLDYQAMLDEIAPGWADGASPELPDLRQVVVYETTPGGARADQLTLDALAASGREHTFDEVDVTGADLGDIVYTSGTTGRPKGVMVAHDGYLRSSYASALTRAFEDGRRLLFSAPLFHMFSYVEAFLPALWVGGAVIPQKTFVPSAFLEAVERHAASEIVAVPTMTVALVEEAERRDYRLDSLFALLSAAASSPIWLWEKSVRVLGVSELLTGYGMTESGAGITMSSPEDSVALVSSTVGRVKQAGSTGPAEDPSRIAVVKTVDPVTGEDLPAGTEGELAVKGPTMMLGFWDKPEETEKVFDGTWLRTGDVGVVTPEGVRLTGRTKELYKSGGELVMPKEVEEIISRLPSVSQVYAIGLPDERWGEIGCAVVVAAPGMTVDPEEVVAHCRAHLARFKVPKRVVVRSADSLPMTASGKVQKFALVQQLTAGADLLRSS
jgi:fatty-acyl-CoA synthase